VSDLFGTGGRELLASLAIPKPWSQTLAVTLRMVDELELEITRIEQSFRTAPVDHPTAALLRTIPGVSWILGYTLAAEIGDITRFSSG